MPLDIRPGVPWYTQPPTAIPLDIHIDYAVAYRTELRDRYANELNGKKKYEIGCLLAKVNAWIKKANRMVDLHHQQTLEGKELLAAVTRLAGRLLRELGRNATPEEAQILKDAHTEKRVKRKLVISRKQSARN